MPPSRSLVQRTRNVPADSPKNRRWNPSITMMAFRPCKLISHSILALIVLSASVTMVDGSPLSAKGSEHPAGAYRVLRITPEDDEQLATLVSLSKNPSEYDLDFWRSPLRVNASVDVMVGPNKFVDLQDFLHRHSFHYRLTIPDVQKLIENKQAASVARAKALSGSSSGNFSRRLKDDSGSPFSLSRYHSYPEIQEYMADLERRYPNLARVFTIGQTHEGRPIQLLKIGSPSSESTSKRGFWIDGGIHAREWVAPSTALYFIDQLMSNYYTDQVIRQYMDQIDWYILPVVNPDGYEYSRSSSHPKTRLWRKNRSPNACRFSNNQHCCQGVDLNRNFDFHWNEVGASNDPCEEIYAGASSFSEPEARAIRDFILYRPGRFDGFVTLHSYSQIWMYPWGHLRNTYPQDVKDLQTVAIQAKRALQANYGTKYIVGTGADTLYPASGGSDDWAKEKLAIKYVYLIELRPEEHIYDGFILDESLITPTGRETWDGIKIVADAILEMNNIKSLNPQPPPPAKNAVEQQCVDHESPCRWWASFGGCTLWANMDKRCPRACRMCDPDTA